MADSPARATDHGSDAPALEVSGVTVRFGGGDVVALSDVSVRAMHGSITGLVGHNGAGKSTLIHLLAGVLLPDAGQVRVLGLDPADVVEGIRAHRCAGFLLEEEALFDYLTGREFLEFIAEAFDIPPDEGTKRIASMAALFALGDDLERLIDSYSTGMRKKIAIAAAMLPGPSILVLDEPFESIDPAMVRRLSLALRAFADRGGTVLLSSHLLHAVQKVCDTVVFLDRGRVVAERRLGATGDAGASGDEGDADLADTYAEVIVDSVLTIPDWLGGARPRDK